MFDHVHYYKPDEFLSQLELLGNSPIAIFISTSAAKRFGVEDFLREMISTGWVWIERMTSYPTPNAVAEVLSELRGKNIKKIVAVGGGSSIDIAKITSAMLPVADINSPRQIVEVVQAKQYLASGKNIPIIAVPTTAGTGSEVTAWATLWDNEQTNKYSVEAPGLVPSEVWMVPDFLRDIPVRIALSTGLDAICQASEAYWARRSNPLVQALSIRAIQMMLTYLPAFLTGDTSRDTLVGLATGSLVAGFSFSRTRTTACHSISYPLTSLFQIEHGFAVALTLAPVAAINAHAVNCTELFETFGGDISARLDTLCRGIQPLRLSAFGIEKTDVPLIARNAFTSGRMDNNPVNLTLPEVESILYSVCEA